MDILKLQRNSIAGNKYEKIYFVTVCSALVFYLIGYGIFSSFSHNVIPSDTGIISKFTLSARIKVPTYVVIILLTSCIGLGAIFGFYLSSLNAFFNSKLSDRILNLSRRTLHAMLILGLCLIASFKNPGAVMTDYFHDGERLAFLAVMFPIKD